MKKLFTLFIIAGLAFAVNSQAQDIDNTLGENGYYYINSFSGNPRMEIGPDLGGYFNVNSTSGAEILAITPDFGGLTSFHLYNEDGNNTEFSIFNDGTNTLLNFNLGKARVTEGNLTAVANGDVLGNINFQGHTGTTSYQTAASITAVVTGAPAGSFVPSQLEFMTGTDAAAPVMRMSIKSDGTINIPGLTATGSNQPLYVDTQGNLTLSAPEPNNPGMNEEMALLKAENQLMKKRLEKLEAIVEELAKQK